MQKSLGRLVDSLVFCFEDFTLSKHERIRIETTINELFKEGKLTKDAGREAHYIGTFLVRKLASGILTDVITNGTINWDVTLAKTLSIVLTTALASRTGDITTAGLLDEHELPFLCYKDITFKLVKGDGLANLAAEVVNRKRETIAPRGNAAGTEEFKLEALKNNEDNVICPIKLLLILALKFGNFYGKKIDEALRLAAERRDKTIQWVHPKQKIKYVMLNY